MMMNMAVYQWLDDMKRQFHYIDDEGAFAELDVEEEKESYATCRQANNTYFLSVPQVLRRCFFLSVNEKAVPSYGKNSVPIGPHREVNGFPVKVKPVLRRNIFLILQIINKR